MTRKSLLYHDLLRDLPPALQRAVCQAVARCRPRFTPRPYHSDWEEELYQEAALAAWQAYLAYNPTTGCSFYQWGARVIEQHLKRFCDRVWANAKHECDYPCDEETGEPVEFEDLSASAPLSRVDGAGSSGACSIAFTCWSAQGFHASRLTWYPTAH